METKHPVGMCLAFSTGGQMIERERIRRFKESGCPLKFLSGDFK
jgi:hypothetical protein